MDMEVDLFENGMEEDWRSELFAPSGSSKPAETPFWEQELENKTKQRNEPDGIWLIPVDVSPQEFLGEKKFIINKIRSATGAYMLYNDDFKQIEMWGTPSSIIEAKRAWNSHGEHILALRDNMRQQKKKNKKSIWNKPDKPLSSSQEKKQHRKKERRDRESYLSKIPVVNKQYNGLFVLPVEPINVQKIFGKGEQYLKKIRQDTNCHIWFEFDDSILRIAGDSEGSVDLATSRIRNLFLQKTQTIVPRTIHLLQAPRSLIRIKLEDPTIIRPIQWSSNMEVKVLRAVTHHIMPGNKEDSEEEDYQDIAARNLETFQDALSQVLTQLCVFKGEISMAIRIGQVCLDSYPNKEKWKVIKLYNSVLPSDRLSSLFAPDLFYSKKDVIPLLEFLSREGLEFTASPKTVYQIRARNADCDNPQDFIISLNFNSVKSVGSWDIDADAKNVLTVNWIFPENDYSWQLNLSTKKCLLPQNDGPWGEFVNRIRLSEQDQFIFTNTTAIQLLTMSRNTEWIYSWHDFIVVVWREELWTYDGADAPDLEVVLPPNPNRTCFGVKLKFEPWCDKFIDNRFLQPGETTQWRPEELADLEKIAGFTASLTEFVKVLERTLNNRP
ncbi:hypothetical protein K493DRAFT_403569 [Basidiobolus meristosporus CBS 931.73]|uniref:Uncharacterized protein n=1 Tax=Basidiobolus meristosporus CBS 931.73 TaxID=1314790 RepID=A0A1Y1ZCS6_9FUNG|nr:hypothetical protein K493DRAFT_403569 [Basidiobolus meristosporus CBS 931.73]|eukprot:ORY08016.1 hypothetical protein K493DRAFT_403569 [Basidiobolus meristosporus CBS 931.73]